MVLVLRNTFFFETKLNSKERKAKTKAKTVNEITKRRITKNNIYEFFKHHGYTEEEIEKVLDNLTETQRKALHYNNVRLILYKRARIRLTL